MLFICCDDAIPRESQLVFALKTLCGFSTGEIALRLFTSEANVHKRLGRARDRLREASPAVETPPLEALRSRLPSVHEVLYLLFNEGYLSAHAALSIRRELCEEAIRLATVLAEHPVGEVPETFALLALFHLHAARLAARLDGDGGLLLLDEQDRSLWDRDRIGEGLAKLERAVRLRRPGEYQLQAAITALQIQAPDADSTDWPQIAELFGALANLNPSPVIELNRAVAVGLASGPGAGLELLEPLLADPALEGYQPLHAAHAELLGRAADAEGAARAYERAIALTANDVERAELERRLAALR
jgi:RNA polymerase sigma-70 factor (ECF subfamily)